MGIFGKVFGGKDSGGFGKVGSESAPRERGDIVDIINRGPVRPDGVMLVEQAPGKKGMYTVIGGMVYSGNLYQGQKAEINGKEITIRSIEARFKPVLDAHSGETVVLKIVGAEPHDLKQGMKIGFSSSTQ